MTKKISVMLIDDNKIDLFIHHQLIKQMDFAEAVVEYSFANEALEFLKKNDASSWPQVILLDIHMPIMNGFDFLDQYALLSEPLRNNCTVIAVSSSLDIGDKLKANESVMVLQLMEKPLNIQKLRNLLVSENVI